MLTGRQVRNARKLARLNIAALSRETCLPQALLQAVESSDREAWLTPEQEAALREALKDRGIDFTSVGDVQRQTVDR